MAVFRSFSKCSLAQRRLFKCSTKSPCRATVLEAPEGGATLVAGREHAHLDNAGTDEPGCQSTRDDQFKSWCIKNNGLRDVYGSYGMTPEQVDALMAKTFRRGRNGLCNVDLVKYRLEKLRVLEDRYPGLDMRVLLHKWKTGVLERYPESVLSRLEEHRHILGFSDDREGYGRYLNNCFNPLFGHRAISLKAKVDMLKRNAGEEATREAIAGSHGIFSRSLGTLEERWLAVVDLMGEEQACEVLRTYPAVINVHPRDMVRRHEFLQKWAHRVDPAFSFGNRGCVLARLLKCGDARLLRIRYVAERYSHLQIGDALDDSEYVPDPSEVHLAPVTASQVDKGAQSIATARPARPVPSERRVRKQRPRTKLGPSSLIVLTKGSFSERHPGFDAWVQGKALEDE